MTKEAIAKRLRQARLAKGMSQQEVGSALTPPQRRHEISRYERNGATPNVITIAQLAAALGVTPCWLAFGDDAHNVSFANGGTITILSVADISTGKRPCTMLVNEADHAK